VSTPPHDPPPAGEPRDPAHAQSQQPPQFGELHCPRCGAPHDPLQEYCLECGLRLVALPRQRYTRTIVWSRESPIWLWIALAALLLVALAAGGIVALAATDDDNEAAPGVSSLTSTTDTVPVTPPPITLDTLTGESTLTIPTSTTTTTTITQPTTSTQPTTTSSTTIISWPSGTDGWTVILRSTPVSEGRGPAESAAQQAINAGLRQVGVLNSSDYDSLNPGYYVTFTGVYTSKTQAEGALPNARSKGFPTAYVRRVAD
jgi:hypothetical protein